MDHEKMNYAIKNNISEFHRKMALFIQKRRYPNLQRNKKEIVDVVKSFFTMTLEKKERVFLIELFYQDGSNFSRALREYRHLKRLRKNTMSRFALKTMITKFEKIGELSLNPGRGRKRISNEIVEEITLTMFERKSDSK